MDSFEANKIFGAILGTVFVLFGGSLLAENIFHSAVPEQPGYAIEAPEESAEGGAEEVARVPIAALLQDADAEAGATVFRRCASCHSAEEGAPAGVGPHMWGVVNRPIAADAGFAYSAAMTEFGQGGSVVWDYEHLDGFLLNPRQYVAGTAMGFAGISSDGDRADLIAYLRTLAAEPAPLPEPPAEGEAAPAEGEAAPAEGEAAAPAAEGEAAPAAAEGEAAPAEGAAAPAEGEAAPAAGTTTDASQPAADQPQAPATTDPAAGEAPVSESPTTGEATDPGAATPSEAPPAGQAAPADEGAAAPAAPGNPAEPATTDTAAASGEAAAPEAVPAGTAPAPQGTTIVPAQ